MLDQNEHNKLYFFNQVIDKNSLKKLITWAFRNYGIARAANMVDKIKDIGFTYATKAGISLSIEDLTIPPIKKELLNTTITSIKITDHRYSRGEITAVERFQKVIDTWNNASEDLKKEVINYFKINDPLNSIYMMAFSGARGNISQVRQLVGMRGLMSDPQGQIIDLPICSNFREGLTITDYFISSYGARKGLVDTALRTADSGYLTRRLVDVSQDIIIREYNCKTERGILIEAMQENQKSLIRLTQSLVGRVLADNIYHPKDNTLLGEVNEIINPQLSTEIDSLKIKKVLVRSPMTCNSGGSVCQLCYGWNLAHGKLVDLGEAVGIIAAQSIGEPGTQLTMRTFHTGGVFTGELAQTIISPANGTIQYPQQYQIKEVRTRHGDNAYLIENDCQLQIIDNHNKKYFINLNKGALLFPNNKAVIKKDELVAEYPLSNRLPKERAQKSIITDFSGKVQFTNLTVEEIQNSQNIVRIAQNSGLVWVLSGQTYHIPDTATLDISRNSSITPNSVLATTIIQNKYPGIVKIIASETDNNPLESSEVHIITDSLKLTKAVVKSESKTLIPKYHLITSNNEKFLVKVQPNTQVQDGQIIAELCSDMYQTQTGGIIKYLDLPISTHKKNNDAEYNISGPGYILWISEETHEINKDQSLLLVNHGDFVESGTELIKNTFAQNAGIVEIIQKDEIIQEIIIKPGDIYVVNKQLNNSPEKKRGFLRPGETIIGQVTTNKLVYWEYIKTNNAHYILIRPVIVYSVPERIYKLHDEQLQTNPSQISLTTIKKTPFKDGERIKSVNGVNLINIYLIIQLNDKTNYLKCLVNLELLSKSKNYRMQFVLSEILKLKTQDNYEKQTAHHKTKLLVTNEQYVKTNTILAKYEIIAKRTGIVEEIEQSGSYNKRLLIITDLDVKTIQIPDMDCLKVKVGDWICSGDYLSNEISSFTSGIILKINTQSLILRIGKPYLVANGTLLHINHNNLVQKGETIATIIFERVKTGDIIQGLPRIEEILEARKKLDETFNPHVLLESKFYDYLQSGLNLYDATSSSIQELQLFLVKEIQLVYQSQGVDIADKHIEIIVKQMTSKVIVETGGETDYLPGEIVELAKIHAMNQTMEVLHKISATYIPILLGITKTSLNTNSFISAASFQETTKVLTEAAISGKLDWLKGLKENVIIGRLIPAGTGFNMYQNNIEKKILRMKNNDSSLPDTFSKPYSTLVHTDSSNLEDIILDDRSARGYRF